MTLEMQPPVGTPVQSIQCPECGSAEIAAIHQIRVAQRCLGLDSDGDPVDDQSAPLVPIDPPDRVVDDPFWGYNPHAMYCCSCRREFFVTPRKLQR